MVSLDKAGSKWEGMCYDLDIYQLSVAVCSFGVRVLALSDSQENG